MSQQATPNGRFCEAEMKSLSNDAASASVKALLTKQDEIIKKVNALTAGNADAEIAAEIKPVELR